MRMTVNQLVAKEIYDINYIEVPLLLSYLGIEKHMQEHIPKFLGKLVLLSLENGVTQFICFFYGLRTQGFVRLLAVPWAFLAEFIEHIENPSESLHFFLSCMHMRQ